MTSFASARCRRSILLAALCLSAAAWGDNETRLIELTRDGDKAAAMRLAASLLQKSPTNPRIQFLHALVLQENGRNREAVAAYLSLIDQHPELPEPYNNLAQLYLEAGQLDESRVTLELGARASRSLANRHEKLSDIYADLATRTYRQYLQSGDTGSKSLPLIRQLIADPATASAVARAQASRRSVKTPARAASAGK